MLRTLAPDVKSWDDKKPTKFQSFVVHSHSEVVLVDPTVPDLGEQKQIRELGTVKAIVITGPNHERDSVQVGAMFNAPVYAHADALAGFEAKSIQPLPAELPLGLQVFDASGAFKGEVVYYVPANGGTLIVGDSWHNLDLTRAPFLFRMLMKYIIKLRHGLHLTPPVRTENSQLLIEQSRKFLDRPVERLLVTHGECITENAKPQMLARLDQGA